MGKSWERDIDLTFRGWTAAAGIVAAGLLAWVVLLGTRVREEPSRCPAGFVQNDARCCAPGQGLSRGACVGAPDACPAPARLVQTPAAGCALRNEKVAIPGGSVELGPTDWDTTDLSARTIAVHSFSIDRLEVTWHRYTACTQATQCDPLGSVGEPGQPVTGLSPASAEKFCAFEGGRLPTPEEWIFAASGTEGRRYPWGPHGLVCRRSAFGLAKGPCAEGGTAPELAGMRPDGETPEGLADMAGNVSEWAMNDRMEASIHGGSYRATHAGQLKTWSTQLPEAGPDVGFRCAYDQDAAGAPRAR